LLNSYLVYSSSLKTEAIYSFETRVNFYLHSATLQKYSSVVCSRKYPISEGWIITDIISWRTSFIGTPI
jgi:hypothetical protein